MGLFAPIVKGPAAGTTPFAPRATAPTSVPYTVLSPAQQAAITPLSPSQISQDAANTAAGEVNAQIAPLQSEQGTVASTAAAQAQSTAAFNAAASKLLGTVGPQSQAGYGQAAQEATQLSQGFSAPLQATLTDEQAQQAAQAQQFGATGQNAPQQVDPSAFGDALKMGNGFIPSSNLLAQGAAANQWGQGLQSVNTDVGRSMLQSEQTTENANQAKISQQIADVAAKYPQLFTSQEHADIQNNLAKVTQGVNVDKTAQTAAIANAHITYENDQVAISQANAKTKAIIANNNAIFTQDKITEKHNYDQATIKIKGQQANNALLKIQQTGQQVDKNSSLVKGYIVLKSGQVPMFKGQPIPVDPRSYGSQSVTGTPTYQYGKAVKSAASMIGRPVPTPTTNPIYFGNSGKYLLDPGLNPDPSQGDHVPTALQSQGGASATTDDPARARKDTTITFAQAVNRLAGEYPTLSRAKVRAAAVAAGWKPDGKRSLPLPPGVSGSTFQFASTGKNA